MEKMKNPGKVIYEYSVTKSKVDEQKKCVRVPFEKGSQYFDVDTLDYTAKKVEKKYSKLKFTGGRGFDNDTSEILFYFK